MAIFIASPFFSRHNNEIIRFNYDEGVVSKIFISYRRKNSAFTLLLANKLSERLDADIFVDFENIDQPDFELSIMRHISESDVFLLMVTEYTFADRIHMDSDWVRREIRTALEQNIPIILISQDGHYPPINLPEDIRDIRNKQGIEFYPAYFDAAVARLVKFLNKATNIYLKTKPKLPTIVDEQTLPVPPQHVGNMTVEQEKISNANGRKILSDALLAYDKEDYGQALFLFESLRDIGYQTRVIDLEETMDQVQALHQREERKRYAAYDYEEIAFFARSQSTMKQALKAFERWANINAEFVEELDTENLQQQLYRQKQEEENRRQVQEQKQKPVGMAPLSNNEENNLHLDKNPNVKTRLPQYPVQGSTSYYQTDHKSHDVTHRRIKQVTLIMVPILILSVVIIGLMSHLLDPMADNPQSLTITPTFVASIIVMESTASSSDTLPSPLPSQLPTLDLMLNEPEHLALNGVSDNAEWQNVVGNAGYVRVFNGIEMVLVPAGHFEMGSTPDEIMVAVNLCNQERQIGDMCVSSFYETETPTNIQQIYMPFWLDRTEVSRAQYQQCIDAGICTATAASNYSFDASQPINLVTWFQANTYCTWRGGRLPTEAEWEYAARGPDRLLFPWGNQFDGNLVNHCDINCANASWSDGYYYKNVENNDGYEVTSSVISFEYGASWVGALNMSGNVWEWTASLYQRYPYDQHDNTGQESNMMRVIRGGSFALASNVTRSANRGKHKPDYQSNSLGFRCARNYES